MGCNILSSVFIKRGDLYTEEDFTEGGWYEEMQGKHHVKIKTETEAIHPQLKIASKPPEVRREAWTDSPSQFVEGIYSVDILISELKPPELRQ